MMIAMRWRPRGAAVAALLLAAGCVAAAAGAGAAAGIYVTTRGVKSEVNQPPAELARRTDAAFGVLLIEVTETRTAGSGRTVERRGRTGEYVVGVKIEGRDSASSTIEVEARKSATSWDKDYARRVLTAILEQP